LVNQKFVILQNNKIINFIHFTLNLQELKIVSLVPSISALLYHLGVEENIVGVTKFCVHPSSLKKTKTIVGGTKNVQIHKVIALAPTLIIANIEENTKHEIQILQNLYYTIVTDVHNIESALLMIAQVGKAIGKTAKAIALIKKIEHSFLEIPVLKESYSFCYLIWKEPFMTVGCDTYIHSVLEKMGLKNIFKKFVRYPITNAFEIKTYKPDIILLATEPYPFKQKHIVQLEAVFPEIPILLINGEICSWHGSHMLEIANYSLKLHKDLKEALKK
jgi:ABC-type Fe3+-hydroxamate transport system substrate-binding protein